MTPEERQAARARREAEEAARWERAKAHAAAWMADATPEDLAELERLRAQAPRLS